MPDSQSPLCSLHAHQPGPPPIDEQRQRGVAGGVHHHQRTHGKVRLLRKLQVGRVWAGSKRACCNVRPAMRSVGCAGSSGGGLRARISTAACHLRHCPSKQQSCGQAQPQIAIKQPMPAIPQEVRLRTAPSPAPRGTRATFGARCRSAWPPPGQPCRQRLLAVVSSAAYGRLLHPPTITGKAAVCKKAHGACCKARQPHALHIG